MIVDMEEFYLDVITRIRNLVEYGMYQKDKTKAIKSLRKKHPAVSLEQITEIFDSLFFMYKETVEFVNQHNEYYWNLYPEGIDTKDIKPELTDFEKSFYERFAEIPLEIIKWTISWVFFWHHLK